VAILHADAIGYTRLTEASEDATLDALDRARKRFEASIAAHGGRIVGTAGDAILAEFNAVTEAVIAAVEVQRAFAAECDPQAPGLQFRVGIHLGDVVPEGDDIFGDGVNVAQRIESSAENGGICISGAVFDLVRDKLDLTYIDLGNVELKNLRRRVRIYAVRWDRSGEARQAADVVVPAPPSRPTIAVLPFASLGGNEADRYFADGITDSVINALACSRWFVVIGRGTSFRFRDTDADIRDLGRELGARYLLQGSVQRTENRVRVVSHLIEAGSGHLVASHRYDEALVDALNLQDAIALQVASTLEPELMGAESSKPRRPPELTGALDHVFRAYARLWEMTRESEQEARRHLELARELNPDLAQAHLWLAIAAAFRIYMGWSERPTADLVEAREQATRAVMLDRNDPWAHMALGIVGLQAGVSNDMTIAHLRRALQLNPSLALAYGFLANALNHEGQPAAAADALRIAMRLSPKDIFLFYWLDTFALSHLIAGRWAEAAHFAERTTSEAPRWPGGHRMLAVACAYLGETNKARCALDAMLNLSPVMSRAYISHIMPFKNREHLDMIVRGLELAGWNAEA
jgi:adenylate cyclase